MTFCLLLLTTKPQAPAERNALSELRVNSFSVSIDAFGAGPNQEPPESAKLRTLTQALRDRKSTPSELQSPMYLVCRLLLEKKKRGKYDLHFCLLDGFVGGTFDIRINIHSGAIHGSGVSTGRNLIHVSVVRDFPV